MREITADPQREWTREGERPAPGADAGYPHRPGGAPVEDAAAKAHGSRRTEDARTEAPRDGGGIHPRDIPGARKARMPATIKPQLAMAAGAAPEGDDWLHEVKFDGYRLVGR